MFEWLKKKVCYLRMHRIRKPKKDEVLLFQLPKNATVQECRRFRDLMDVALKEEGPFIVIPESIKMVTIAKKKQVKTK